MLQKKEKEMFVELKTILENLRGECFNAIEERRKLLEDKESEIYKLLSVAEQLELIKRMQEQYKEIKIKNINNFEEVNKKTKELEEKFSKEIS